jgi:hypothetical protein
MKVFQPIPLHLSRSTFLGIFWTVLIYLLDKAVTNEPLPIISLVISYIFFWIASFFVILINEEKYTYEGYLLNNLDKFIASWVPHK